MRIAIVLAALLATIPAAVAAQQFTAPDRQFITRDQLAAALRGGHGETPRAAAVSTGGNLIELFGAPASNWTLTETLPNGMSRVIDAGKAWLVYGPPRRPAKGNGL